MRNIIPKQKINVMHIIYSLYAGGAEEVIAAYCQSHNRDRYNLSVLVITDGGPLVDRIMSYGVPVFLLKKKKRLQLTIFWKIFKIMHREKVDIVHAHNPAGNNWGVIPAKFAGVQVFLRTEHNVYYPGRVTRFYPIINYFFSLFNHYIISCSDLVRQSQIQHYKVPEYKFITIRNGVIPERFKNENPIGYLEKEFGIPENKKVIGTIGALIKQKGHIYLLDAAEIIIKKYPDTYFLLVGDGKEKETLRKLAKTKGINHNVIFAGLRQDIPQILNSLDIFLLPSLWEGLPMVILEAMASKLCIIATNVGGNHEAIIDGKTGFLVESMNPKEIARRIEYVLNDPEGAKVIAENAYTFFNEKFTVDKMIGQTEALYERCLIR